MTVLRSYDDRVMRNERPAVYEDDASTLLSSLVRAVASGADLTGLDMTDLLADGVDLRNARFAGAVARRAVFMRCDLSAADFRGASLEFARFEACQLGGASFAGASARDSSFRQCDLWEASFEDAYFLRSSFFSCSLLYADFTGADLGSASFRFSDLAAWGKTEWQEARANLAADKIPWRSMEFLAEVLRRAAGRDRRKLQLAKLCWASRGIGEFNGIGHPDMAWALSILGSLVKPPKHANSGALLVFPEILDEYLPAETAEWIKTCQEFDSREAAWLSP